MATTSEPYDVYFAYRVPERLENDRILLVPFIPNQHAEPFIKLALQYPEIYDYLPMNSYSSAQDFTDQFLSKIQRDPTWVLFAVYDKTKSSPEGPQGAFAGIIGLLNSFPSSLTTEIGFVVVLPPFQKSHVASNMVGVLMNYCLDLPPTGLGLRRVVWQANKNNVPSIRLAEKMGFQPEVIVRWDRVLPLGKGENADNGWGEREGDPKAGHIGRDTAILSMCWDDWENGGKEKVKAAMDRGA